MNQKHVKVRAGRGELLGMIYEDRAGGARDTAVLICNPFGDERKSSCLALSRMACHIARKGFRVLRFDYYGTGDSPGDFREATLESRLDDIASAAEFLSGFEKTDGLVLIGLRYGALLAARSARGIELCRGVALLEPVPDGRSYFERQIQRKKVRQMITSGKASSSSEEDGEEIVDLDGYPIPKDIIEGLQSPCLSETELSGKILLVQISFDENLRRETKELRDSLGSGDTGILTKTVVLPPFWSRIDITDTTELNEVASGWLTDLWG